MTITRRKFLGFFIPISLTSFSFSSSANNNQTKVLDEDFFKLDGEYNGDDVCLSFEKLLKKKKAIFINNNLSFHKRISFSRDESLFLLTSPNANVSGTGFFPKLKTNPNHVIAGNTIR